MDTQGESNPSVKFHPLDREAEIQVRARNLPHWFQPGTAIFVTFRTADSMPAEVLQRWQIELEEWLLHAKLPIELADSVVNRRHQNHVQLLEKLSDVQQSEFRRLSNRIFHRCLDECHGECLMRQSELAAQRRAIRVLTAIHCRQSQQCEFESRRVSILAAPIVERLSQPFHLRSLISCLLSIPPSLRGS